MKLQKKLQKILDQIKTPLLIATSERMFYIYAKEPLSTLDLRKIPSRIDNWPVKLQIGKLVYWKSENIKNDFYKHASNTLTDWQWRDLN